MLYKKGGGGDKKGCRRGERWMAAARIPASDEARRYDFRLIGYVGRYNFSECHASYRLLSRACIDAIHEPRRELFV